MQPLMDGSGQVAAEPFYTDPDCQRMFRDYMGAVVQRTNSLTGVHYRWAAWAGGRRRAGLMMGPCAACTSRCTVLPAPGPASFSAAAS